MAIQTQPPIFQVAIGAAPVSVEIVAIVTFRFVQIVEIAIAAQSFAHPRPQAGIPRFFMAIGRTTVVVLCCFF